MWADLTHAEGLEMVSGFSTALGFPPVCAQRGGRIQDQHPLHGAPGSRGAGGKHKHGSLPCFTCWGYGAGLLPALLAALPHLCFFFFFPPAQQPALAALPPSPPFSPVALPGVPHVRVVDAVLICLLIQEIEHVLDGQRERAAAVHGAEQRLKQVVHKLLQRTLKGAAASKVKEGWRHTRALHSPMKHSHRSRIPQEQARSGALQTLPVLQEDWGLQLPRAVLPLYF